MNNLPRFILSKKKVLEKYNSLKELGLNISYSLKTNLEVGKILEENSNSMFSVHSIKELDEIKDKKRIWYFLLASSFEELKKIFDKGVRNFIVDLPTDLDLLINFIDEKEEKINLLLRAKLKENTIFSGKNYVFGMNSSTIANKIDFLKENKYVDKLGIHFHRKTQNISEWNLKEDLENLLSAESLQKIDLLNIGGGLPGVYKNTNNNSINLIFKKILDLKKYFKKEIIIEPGRYIASESVDLECNITAIERKTIFVNCSIFNSALDTIVANIKLLVDGEKKMGEKYMIKGCTPASEDIFRYEVYLINPKVGDKLKFLNAGAYNYTTDFCSLKKIKTFII
jgi:ornithine decarboxylase